jgi:endonuclease YncB( thermonuclease family)
MRNRWGVQSLLFFLTFVTSILPAFAGDSLYGKVTEVRSANVVILDYGAGRYVVRIIGVDVPKDEALANQAREFVSKLVLGKNVRMRLGSRQENGDMVSQLFTADPASGIKDVGLELVRAGLAQRQQGEDYQFGYKYNELAGAQREAREAKRGMWTPAARK